MADGHDVFDAKIKATDQASPLVQKIAASVRGLAPLMKLVATHSAGMGAVIKAAMGEAAHGAHGAGKAAHGAAHAIAAAGAAAKHAGPEIEHAAHPRAWLALAAHANLFRSHLGGIRMGVAEVGHSITEFLPALGALSVGGGLVGLVELTEKVADRFSEMNKAAIGAGMGIRQFQQLSLAAKMTDVSVETAAGGMFKLNNVIAKSAAGKNKDALALFHHLGLHLREANGHLVDSAKLLPELAEAFKNTHDPAMQARMAMALFGKSGKEMLPMLMAGREELEEFQKKSDELNYPFSEDDKRGLEGYHRSLIGISIAVSAFADEIGAKLAPVLRPAVDAMTEAVVVNRHWIAQGLAAKVKQLAEWFKRLAPHFREIVEQTQAWVSSTLTLGGHVDSLTTIIGALALTLGSPLLVGIAGAISAFTGLGRVVLSLGAIAWANPIIAGAMLVGLAAYEIYEHWDFCKQKVGEVWDWFKNTDFAKGAVAAIQPFKDLPGELTRLWDTLKAPWVALWADLTAEIEAAWAKIQPIVEAIRTAVGAVQNSWIGRQLHLDVEHNGAPGADGAPGVPSPWGGPPIQTDMPQLYGPRANALPAGPRASRDGTVRTEITIRGLPPGSTVQSSAAGAVEPPTVDVGYSLAGAFGVF